MKTILQCDKPCPNGIVGEQIALSLKLSEWLWEQTLDRKIVPDKKLDEIEDVMLNALHKIEKLLKLKCKK